MSPIAGMPPDRSALSVVARPVQFADAEMGDGRKFSLLRFMSSNQIELMQCNYEQTR